MTTAAMRAEAVMGSLGELHQDCFACGVCNHSGLHMEFDVGTDGVARAVWQPSKMFRSYPDRLHGGVIATLVDSAIVHALSSKNVLGVTAELTIRFLQSVNVTDPVAVSGWVESVRHGVYLCCAEVQQMGLLAVRASAKFMVLRDPPDKLAAA